MMTRCSSVTRNNKGATASIDGITDQAMLRSHAFRTHGTPLCKVRRHSSSCMDTVFLLKGKCFGCTFDAGVASVRCSSGGECAPFVANASAQGVGGVCRLQPDGAGAMATQCCGVTRKGARCSINSASRLTDERGRPVAQPLQRGGVYCRFHARPFVTQPVADFVGPALVLFLDLETTGVDVASDQVVELACCQMPSEPHFKGAVFSTVVCASAEDTAFHIHGIDPSERAAGPVFSVAWSRFLVFVEHLQMAALQDCSDSDCDPDESATILPSEPATVLLAAHNGVRFDFAMLLFELVRHGMSWSPLEQWLFVDTLALVQAVGGSNMGGCAKLQCMVRGHCGGLQAHRALDDCVALRAVVHGVAESYGVCAVDVLRPLVMRLDVTASAAQVSTL